MKYSSSIKAEFINRPNRFVADVMVEGVIHRVHVKNTGRCKELLIEGCGVYLTKSDNPDRKTAYDLVCVEKINDDGSITLFNIDSQAANKVAEEWLNDGGLFPDVVKVKRECKFGNSRFDFYIERENEKAFLEVKGVTLDVNKVALFPDAPTERGVKHINEIIEAMHAGYGAYILFVLQYKGAKEFRANIDTHKAFADALVKARNAGVKIYAVDCEVSPENLRIDEFVKVNI